MQTWFSFTGDLCLNGRDRPARQRDHCFVWVQGTVRALIYPIGGFVIWLGREMKDKELPE